MNQTSGKRQGQLSSFVNKVQMSQLWSESVITVLSAKSEWGKCKILWDWQQAQRSAHMVPPIHCSPWGPRQLQPSGVLNRSLCVTARCLKYPKVLSLDLLMTVESTVQLSRVVTVLRAVHPGSHQYKVNEYCISDNGLTVGQARMSVVAHSFFVFNKLPWRCTVLSCIERDTFGLTL